MAVFLCCASTGQVGLWFVVLCGSYDSCSGFRASQKMGQQLKVPSDRMVEAENRTCDPRFTRHRFIPYKKNLFEAFQWVVTSTGPGGFMVVCVFYDGSTRRLANSGFMEKPGIEPAIPGLQGIGLSPTQKKKLFVAFLDINQFRRVGLRLVCWFYVRNTIRLT